MWWDLQQTITRLGSTWSKTLLSKSWISLPDSLALVAFAVSWDKKSFCEPWTHPELWQLSPTNRTVRRKTLGKWSAPTHLDHRRSGHKTISCKHFCKAFNPIHDWPHTLKTFHTSLQLQFVICGQFEQKCSTLIISLFTNMFSAFLEIDITRFIKYSLFQVWSFHNLFLAIF